MQKYVIVGNGIAGISAAETIRSIQPQGDISIIAEESFPPYSRPLISLLLEGRIEHEGLLIRGPSYYSKLGIKDFVGEKVVSIDIEGKKVFTNIGRTVDYDRLLIATGANPRSIRTEGATLGNISYMRTECQIRTVVQNLSFVKHALVLGGGLVGFKAAYGLMRRGIKVTMLIRSGYPLSMQVDPTAGQMILDELLANGMDIRTEVEATAFRGADKVQEACLSDGSSLKTQLVMVGKGVVPALDFVPREKIHIDLGILVDEHLETSSPGVFAAGDVAQATDVVRHKKWVNAIWPVAAEQGIVAGFNMAGRPVSYRGSLGRNVLRIFRLDVLSGGIIDAPSHSGYRTLTYSNPFKRIYRKIVIKDSIPVGLVMVGDIEQGGIILSLIHRQLPLMVEPELLLDPHFSFSSLLSTASPKRRIIA